MLPSAMLKPPASPTEAQSRLLCACVNTAEVFKQGYARSRTGKHLKNLYIYTMSEASLPNSPAECHLGLNAFKALFCLLKGFLHHCLNAFGIGFLAAHQVAKVDAGSFS